MSMTAIILAGGQSSRFQYQDKSLKELQGQTFLERAIQVVYDRCEQIILSVKNQKQQIQYQRLLQEKRKDLSKLTFIPDSTKYERSGPLVGILSVLPQIKSKYTLILSVDMPRVTGHLIDILFREIQKSNAEVVSYRDEHNYLTTAFFVVRTKFAQNYVDQLSTTVPARVSNLFRLAQKVIILSIDQTQKLVNINTQEALTAAKHTKEIKKKASMLTREIVTPKDSLLNYQSKTHPENKLLKIAKEEFLSWQPYHIKKHIQANIEGLLQRDVNLE